MNTQIKATIIADSVNPQGDRITSMLLTIPYFLLNELKNYKEFSINEQSYDNISFEDIIKDVEENPFIPIAWKKSDSTTFLSKILYTIVRLSIKKSLKSRITKKKKKNAIAKTKLLKTAFICLIAP